VRILVVDDSAAVRGSLRALLCDVLPGTTVSEATGAAPALECVRAERWDLVLLDLSLPDRSGVEALRDIRRERPELPVVVMSLHPAEHYRPAMLAAGAADYVAKGSPAATIAAVVRSALGLA
jgi:DNA-binding NarL/FixJ family response regulator